MVYKSALLGDFLNLSYIEESSFSKNDVNQENLFALYFNSPAKDISIDTFTFLFLKSPQIYLYPIAPPKEWPTKATSSCLAPLSNEFFAIFLIRSFNKLADISSCKYLL